MKLISKSWPIAISLIILKVCPILKISCISDAPIGKFFSSRNSKTFPENQDTIGPSVGWPKNYPGLFRLGLDYIFLVIKLFCSSRQKAEIFSIFLIKNFMTPHKIANQSDSHGNKNCLHELDSLKFCEVSRNSFSNRC